MACSVDHLRPGVRVRVLRDFSDKRGTRHRAGVEAVIRDIRLDLGRAEFTITWERAGLIEALTFSLTAQDGPRHGRMKDYFGVASATVGESREQPRDRPGPNPLATTPPRPRTETDVASSQRSQPPPALPRGDWNREEPGLQQVGTLAVEQRFAEARERLFELCRGNGGRNERLQELAEALGRMAVARAGDPNRSVYEWLRDRSKDLWYAWGSTATSGGEGAARSVEIDAAMERFRRLDRT